MDWVRVDPKAYAAAMKIISDGPQEGEDGWDVLERANVVMGHPPRKRRKVRAASTPDALKGDAK